MTKQRQWVELYADGACSPNPGTGGWAALLRYRGRDKLVSGRVKDTTNNRMELMAIIQGLRALKWPCRVTIYTDSQYIWRLANSMAVRRANKDLWREYDKQAKRHTEIVVNWVYGHNDNPHHNRSDRAARRQALGQATH